MRIGAGIGLIAIALMVLGGLAVEYVYTRADLQTTAEQNNQLQVDLEQKELANSMNEQTISDMEVENQQMAVELETVRTQLEELETLRNNDQATIQSLQAEIERLQAEMNDKQEQPYITSAAVNKTSLPIQEEAPIVSTALEVVNDLPISPLLIALASSATTLLYWRHAAQDRRNRQAKVESEKNGSNPDIPEAQPYRQNQVEVKMPKAQYEQYIRWIKEVNNEN